jgi:hypothetical protein
MFANLQTKYDWVLDSLVYDFPQSLIDVLDDALINPALEKRHELELRKARNTPTRHVTDYPSIRNLESGWFDGTSVNSISSLTSVDHSFKKKQLARIESSGFHRNSLGDPTKPGMASFAFRTHQLFPRLPSQLQRSSLSSARVTVNNVGTFHPSITCAAAQH